MQAFDKLDCMYVTRTGNCIAAAAILTTPMLFCVDAKHGTSWQRETECNLLLTATEEGFLEK